MFKKSFSLFILLLLLSISDIESQTSCDYSIQMISTDLQNFNTRGYNPLNIQLIYNSLNNLRASILTAYQLCFGRIIIDPDSMYPQDVGGCFNGLYNTSLLAPIYTGNYAKIRSSIDYISKIVFSTQNNCRPVFYYKGWDNLTDDCKSSIQSIDDIINKYDDQIILGHDGLQYINDMLLSSERLRKLCEFNVLLKPNIWKDDKCSQANNKWLYPLTDQIDNFVMQKKYVNVTASFYALYQSIYRVKTVCNVSIQMKNDQQQNQQKQQKQNKMIRFDQ